MPDEGFIQEAIQRAEAEGLHRAAEQRPVDWNVVEEWAKRCQEPDFTWDSSKEVIVSSNGAVCDGQHRILGGLMGENPPPYRRRNFSNDTQPWNEDLPYDFPPFGF